MGRRLQRDLEGKRQAATASGNDTESNENAGPAATSSMSTSGTSEVPNATEITVVLTGRGQAGTESEAHLELINGQYHWFALCE